MKSRVILAVFIAVAIAQVIVPVRMIARRETTLRLGRTYKFRTAPVDPYDAFRGRYVWLGYEQNRARWSGESEPGSFRTAYALVEEGRDGFAVINQVMPQPPKSGDYVKVGRVYRDWQTNSVVHFSLPFDRYYMEETKAPKAEHAYREHLNRRGQTNDNTYAVVRIKSGEAVLEDVYVDGKPIAEFIRGAKP
ncbi:MAG: GDYXXLXY domain-containing protein [Verrucomicrobiia bacterium]|jgi:uncharacterized membrane-anchored protein